MASSKVLEIIVKATDQASKQFDYISKKTKKLSESLKDVKKYSWIATTALAWMWALMVKQATDIEPVKNAFEWLTQTVWESSTEMLKSLKQASKWAVSEYDLMLSANRSMKLGVAQNTEDMTDLMKIARLYGQQMWQDVTQSFNDIVTWLWRWSPMILDNLWIIIDSEKAYEDYAKQLWKTSKELTKAEKTQALVNATLVEWRKALDEFGEPPQTMAERFAELKNSVVDIWAKIWSALLPVLENVLKIVQPIIEKIANWVEKNPELASKILMVATALSWLIFVMSSLPWIISTVTWLVSTMISPFGLVIAWITALAVARATDFWWIREKTAEIVESISNIVKPRLDKFSDWWFVNGEYVKEVVSVLRTMVEKIFGAWIEIVWWLLEWFFNVVDILINVFTLNRDWAWEWIKNLFIGVRETMWKVWSELFGEWLDRVADKLVQLWKWFSDARTNIKNTVLWIASALREWLKTWFEFRVAVFTGDRETASSIVQWIVTWLDQALTGIFWTMRENIKNAFQAWIDWIVDKMNAFYDTVMSIVNAIKDAWNSAKNFVGDVWSWISNAASSAWDFVSSPFRANGWSVNAWWSYIVGERWPELFVPKQSWTIIPNENIVNNNGVTINMNGVSIRSDNDIQQLAQEIVRMTKLEKNYWII